MLPGYQKIYNFVVEILADNGKVLIDVKNKHITEYGSFNHHRVRQHKPTNQFTYYDLATEVSKRLTGWSELPDVSKGPVDNLNVQDDEILLEVFWDLFRQGRITIGWNCEKPNFPYFRLSSSYKSTDI